MKKNSCIVLIYLCVLYAFSGVEASASSRETLQSIDTGYTICLVRAGQNKGRSFIAASSYEGTVLGIRYDGHISWENPLSGYKNHDFWCDDITGDGSDEVLAANADGTVYCLSATGKLLWQFKKNDAPMNAVCVVRKGNTPYVVCGGYDMNIYYLSGRGKLVKTIDSSTYTKDAPWGDPKRRRIPEKNGHIANFLRKIPQPDGSDVLAVQGAMAINSGMCKVYLFKPLADLPYVTHAISKNIASSGFGHFDVCDPDADGKPEVLVGTVGNHQTRRMYRYHPEDGTFDVFDISTFKFGFGYYVIQPVAVSDGPSYRYLALCGNNILLIPPDLDTPGTEVLTCKYSFNDIWKDSSTGKVILASAQSGGSCIHIIDPSNPDWKDAYQNLSPPGKIDAILTNTDSLRKDLEHFTAPSWEREPLPVYLMSERIPESVQATYDDIRKNHSSPVFLNNVRPHRQERSWREAKGANGEYLFKNDRYREARDRRQKYTLTQDQVLKTILPNYKGFPGIAYWAGHGNDPYMYSLDTTKKVLDGAKGKITVLIYPEVSDTSSDFEFVLEDLFYPLASYARKTNGKIYYRTKAFTWQSVVYLPMWKRFLSGDCADTFIPTLEETGSKIMDLSVAARMGIWASGVTDTWGARCARDNTSYDGLKRKHCHQMLPNHFLRNMVYSISCGAQYINNFSVDQDYMSLLWELIAKGALYVPKRSEIVSLSPVHLSMTEPDKDYLNEGKYLKYLTFYDEEKEKNNPMVFSRMNGTWPSAPVTEWDFSRYASGVKDRLLHFLPPYENGIVMITPPQQGVFADKDATRGKLTDHLHPMYKNIMKEYFTDGKHYYSADGKQTYAADEYYRTIEADIKNAARKLPLTVSGDVAWVVAQTSPKHLRLTLIDGGYINPLARTATVSFHTVKPAKMVDLLNGESFDTANPSSVKIDIPCGMFRFIDIELKEPLPQNQ